jgi:hypothetical protein
MDLPDYPAATDAADHLLTGHTGQHRCTNGHYYGPREATNCPTQTAVATLTGTLEEARVLPHVAVHDTEHIDLVMLGMTGLVAGDLEADDRDAWRTSVRNALETHAALLDPAVQS